MTASTALQEVAGGRQAAAIVPWYFTACFAADDDKHHVPSRGDSQRQRLMASESPEFCSVPL